MTRRPGWAEKKVECTKLLPGEACNPHLFVARLLTAEHARALRVVKQHEKTTYTFAEPDAWTLGYRQACIDISEELKRGRT